MASYDPEADDDLRCDMMVDLGCRCENLATRSIREPFTPAGFRQQLCEEHAGDQIAQGYFTDPDGDTEIAGKNKARLERAI